MDQAGYATVESRAGASVEGVLWEIGPADFGLSAAAQQRLASVRITG